MDDVEDEDEEDEEEDMDDDDHVVRCLASAVRASACYLTGRLSAHTGHRG